MFVEQSLSWWCLPENLLIGISFHQKIKMQAIAMDAPLSGWGAHMGHLQIQGFWSPKEQTHHINLLELREVHQALSALLMSFKANSLLVQTDNITTIHYLNKQGGDPVPGSSYNLKMANVQESQDYSCPSVRHPECGSGRSAESFKRTMNGY